MYFTVIFGKGLPEDLSCIRFCCLRSHSNAGHGSRNSIMQGSEGTTEQGNTEPRGI